MKVDFSLLVLPANQKRKWQDINWKFQQFSSIVPGSERSVTSSGQKQAK